MPRNVVFSLLSDSDRSVELAYNTNPTLLSISSMNSKRPVGVGEGRPSGPERGGEDKFRGRTTPMER